MVYSKDEVMILREGGKRLALILSEVRKMVAPGVTTKELDRLAERLIREGGDEPAFLEYQPEGAPVPYPATLCVSVNDEVVHGIPGTRILEEGDIVGVDLGLRHKELFVDMAKTVPVGRIDASAASLIDETEKALSLGIAAARATAHVGDIGYAIERYAKGRGFGIIEDLGGHGVGHGVHEEPFIPNFGRKGEGPKLRVGEVLALEPMLSEGSKNVFLSADDHFTFKTADGKRSAHFEHTILVTEGEAEILTLP
ncbi:MAG: type I methionyl aminopeptidase [Patescibacteria group bacterium]|nr:MAG: type I methionyl aminopeptidase [Patescibacteria group bacterium]